MRMFIKSIKILNSANYIVGRNLIRNNQLYEKYAADTSLLGVHTSAKQHIYVTAETLPLPNNVDAAETTRFSPQRTRDISATVILMQAPISTIDITTDNTLTTLNAGINKDYGVQDAHVQSYDCFGAVSLNAVMQSNVPSPFGGMHKFSHLNMPGGQWSQEYKFMSQNLQSSHYTALREKARADWVAYDQNATLLQSKGVVAVTIGVATNKRCYSTKVPESKIQTDIAPKVLSKKEQLKQAFKQYGITIVVFHIGISLASLAGFYILISSGVNLMPMMEYLGITSTTTADKVATGSSFVVAYAIHKVFAPIRISITLGLAPFIVRYLRRK